MVSSYTRRALNLAFGASIFTVLTGSIAMAADDGTVITLWSRSQNDLKFAELYNSTHKNQVEVTVVPGDTFLQKVGSAAGSGSLPDVLVADVVYAINYASQGVYADITDRIEASGMKDTLVKAHLEAGTVGGRMYGVPHFVDVSMIFYNKDLFTQAGLDPEKFPTSFDELYAAAAKIHALGPDIYGFALQNSPGGWAYQGMAGLAASGEPPLKDDGKVANLNTPAMKKMLTFYKRMLDEGIMSATTRSDVDAGTWPLMTGGKAGMGWAGNWFGGAFGKDVKGDWGVAPWPAIDGGAVGGFVGGDIVGITAGSKKQDAAWDFIAWTLTDEAQVKVLGANGVLPDRTDLADNPAWTSLPSFDKMAEALTNGYTPSTLPYGEIFNVPTGPWFRGIEAALFDGVDIDQALADMQAETQSIIDGAYGQ
jgi:multiple sugar transport system substrate-binding protein